MPEPNPYTPPTQPAEITYRDPQGADAFVDMLPTQQVRAAGVSSILAGVATLFVALQVMIGLRPGAIAGALEAAFVALGLGYFVVAWGLSGARPWAAIVGIVVAALAVALLSVFFLLTLAMSCVAAGIAAVVTLALLAVSVGDVRKMARARAALARVE